ncbi:hypothetical protein CHARACLAT_014600 [Characodon lateralis]|uniref:Zinc finger PHD-type domain-containing protein n=1 Tax=Characodon lateralis TaxID=208331 RepID=A0ABU7DGU8_9TELE|nr:hypothetical protein [Characodon lateralis]
MKVTTGCWLTRFLDPLGESQRKLNRCLEATREFMRLNGLKVSRWTCHSVPHAVQQDGMSCGVFALKFAECILEGKDLKFPSNTAAVNAMRVVIASTCLCESESLENLCSHCGGEDTDDLLWIACDSCKRLYHPGCVKNPPTGTKYCCVLCL